MPLSDWQENCFPEIDGIYQIKDKNIIYHAYYKKDGGWGAGNHTVEDIKYQVSSGKWKPYDYNNNPPTKWRGIIDE